jgi:phytoene synthase
LSAAAPDTLVAAQRAIAIGSRSFAAAARLFDAETRAAAVLLYAWCRHCDDVVDGQALGHGGTAVDDAAARLDRLYDSTRRALAGEPTSEPAFAAFQQVARRHGIPAADAYALLDGFAMDVRGTRYATLDDVLRYCYHVAGVVGLMMGRVLGVRDDATLDRACDLGLAFQLTNIARDVDDDARLGRVYVPEEWLSAAGLDRDRLLAAPDVAAVRDLRLRLLSAAEPYYASALSGVAMLSYRQAWAIAAARGIYRDIGRAIRVSGPGRAVVGRARKLVHVAGGAAVAAALRLVPSPVRPRHGLWRRPA